MANHQPPSSPVVRTNQIYHRVNVSNGGVSTLSGQTHWAGSHAHQVHHSQNRRGEYAGVTVRYADQTIRISARTSNDRARDFLKRHAKSPALRSALKQMSKEFRDAGYPFDYAVQGVTVHQGKIITRITGTGVKGLHDRKRVTRDVHQTTDPKTLFRTWAESRGTILLPDAPIHVSRKPVTVNKNGVSVTMHQVDIKGTSVIQGGSSTEAATLSYLEP